MPTLKRACESPGCSAPAEKNSNTCAEHETLTRRRARYDARRGKTAERGYDARWRKVRAMVLSREPLCRQCARKGELKPAGVVDHIIPHRGDPRLFNDPHNLQPLCAPCHATKTRGEDSGFHEVMYPLDLSRVEGTIVVAGPPAAGKSTLVSRMGEPGDVVCDLDVIKQRVGGDLWMALQERNAALKRLADAPPQRLWFQVIAPDAAERSFWARELGGEVWLLMPEKYECERRAREDTSRRAEAHQRISAIGSWFERYTARPEDKVISGLEQAVRGEGASKVAGHRPS